MSNIKAFISKNIDLLVDKVQHPSSLFVFEKLVYLWFIAMGILLFPIREILFGENTYMFGVRLEESLINNFILKGVYVKTLTITIFTTHILASIWAIISIPRIISFIPKILVFITGWMLFYAAPLVYNGGYILMLAYSFYLIFSNPKSKHSFWIITSNFAYIGIVFQLLVVYGSAAYIKWTGNTWWDGIAVWNAAHISAYSNPWITELYSNNHWIVYLINYVALFYQTAFPIVIWFKKIKKPVLLIGLLFHGFTIFVMELYFFGSAMVLAYLLLLDENGSFLRRFSMIFKK